jgi:hypothetical protein
MSDDRDDLRDRLDAVADDLADDEITVFSTVVTITENMVDENKLNQDKVPDTSSPEGYELGEKIPVQSPVVTVHELTPVGDE